MSRNLIDTNIDIDESYRGSSFGVDIGNNHDNDNIENDIENEIKINLADYKTVLGLLISQIPEITEILMKQKLSRTTNYDPYVHFLLTYVRALLSYESVSTSTMYVTGRHENDQNNIENKNESFSIDIDIDINDNLSNNTKIKSSIANQSDAGRPIHINE